MQLDAQTERFPYEFLARWGEEGEFKGAHIQWRYVFTVDGQRLDERPSEAHPVTKKGAGEFPLADIMAQLQIDALAAVTEKERAIEGLKVELAESMEEQERLRQEIRRLTLLGEP